MPVLDPVLRKDREMKLSVELLDNDVKSAVVNIGKNSGYVEVYLSGGDLVVIVYDAKGDIVHSFDTPWGKK
jgi:hypothetical protein